MRSADLYSCRWVGERIYLWDVNSRQTQVQRYVPPRCVVLQIFALSLEHTTSDLNRSWVVLAWVRDVRNLADRVSRIDHLLVIGNKVVPLEVLGHCQGTFLELLCEVI